MIGVFRRPLDATLKMTFQLVDACPDNLWLDHDQQYWKHILHAIVGIDCWFREEGETFVMPDFNKDITADLDKKSKDDPTKEEMKEYIEKMMVRARDYLDNLGNEELLEPCPIYNKLAKADVLMMHIRHIQHHVGFCNSILRANDLKPVKWSGYFE